jgi:glycosyltransferase involved in cell wall biosynthesis
MPKISVIIPCYNHGQYVDEAVDSILASTFKDFEIIVINDGSTDDFTNQKLDRYDKPQTRVIKTVNQGLSAARNNGIKEAKGKYILPLDADDKIEKTYLEKAVNYLENHPEVQFVTAWLQNFGYRSDIYQPKKCDLIKLLCENILVVASVYPKSCWEKVGGYSVDMRKGYEDWDFWIKMLAAGFKYEVIGEPLIYYRNRPDSMLRDANKPDRRQELFGFIIDKHHDLYLKKFKEIILEKDRKYFSLRRKLEGILPRRVYYWLLKVLKKRKIDL